MCHVREGPRRLCARCGRVLGPVRKPVEGYTGLTWACWWEPIGICHRCRPEGMCTALRDGEYQCLRCELAVGLHKLLLLRSIRPVPPWFLPLRDAILTIPNPRFGLTGVGPAIRALEDLLSGDLPLSHEALDELAQAPSVRRLRALLVTAGALPHPDPDLASLEALLEERLGLVTRAGDSQALAAFGRWLILERAPQQEPTPAEVEDDRARILEPERLLRWLEGQGGSLDDLMPADVEAWLARPGARRWRVCDFLAWALDRGIVSSVAWLLEGRRLILPPGQRISPDPDSGSSPP